MSGEHVCQCEVAEGPLRATSCKLYRKLATSAHAAPQEMTSSRRFRINRYARRYRRTRPSSCAYSDALASSGHRAADANAPAVRKR